MVKIGVSHHKPGVKTVVSEVKTFQTNNKPPTKGEKVTDLHFGSYIREKWCTLIFGELQEKCVQLHQNRNNHISPIDQVLVSKAFGNQKHLSRS